MKTLALALLVVVSCLASCLLLLTLPTSVFLWREAIVAPGATVQRKPDGHDASGKITVQATANGTQASSAINGATVTSIPF